MAMLAFDYTGRIVSDMKGRVYRRTTRFMLCFGAVLAGLVWARFGGELSGWWPVICGLVALVAFRRARVLSVYAVIIFGLALGWWRGALFMNEVKFLDDIAKEDVVLTGRVLNDSVYDERGAISFDLGSLRLHRAGESRPIVGKVGVSGYGERMIYRGDEVRVSGRFYPGKGSYVAWLNYAELEVQARSQSLIYAATRHFAAGIQSALPEPQASFGLGILIGQRDTLPAQTSDILKMVGLTHIIAVSGYNLTILVRATRRLLAKRSKYQAMVGAIVLILAFLLVTGGQPSIVRASIISILSLGAWYYGRVIKPLLIILLAACITALWNPMYLWSDIGWYLSFLAFFGVLMIAPVVKKRLYKERKAGIMGELVIESFAAQIMTLPLILFIFGESSYIVLIANLLVVPLIPLGMIFAFVAGLAGMWLPALAGWIAWPAKLILTYLLDMATLVARIPHMQFEISLGAGVMVGMYAAILLLTVIWWQKLPKSAKITEINYLD